MRWLPIGLAILLAGQALQAQVTSISGNGYTQTTPFLISDKSEKEIFSLALGYRMEGSKRTNVLLYEHVALKYSVDMYDSAATSLDLRLREDKTEGKEKWSNREHFAILRSQVQPKYKSKGHVVAFDLADSLVADIRGKDISRLYVCVEEENSRISKEISSLPTVSKIFVVNAAKIPGGKSAYDPATPFLKNRIPFQSLLSKPRGAIEAQLGAPIKDTARNRTVFQRYASPHGVYEINYKNGLADEVRIYPVYKFHLDDTNLRTHALAFEIQPLNGPDYTGEYTEASGTDEYDKGITYTYKDRKKVRLMVQMENRFIKVAKIEND